jgi:tetratricopeptide (TPR) repeat protein
MSIRGLLIITGVSGSILLIAAGARASVTVLGPGPAAECYEAAEFGGDAKEAIPVCSFALQTVLSTADRAATYINRGVLRLGIKENDDAITDMDAGIALLPDSGDAYVDRGAVLIALGRYDEALAALNKGLTLTPRRPQVAYYDRAILLEKTGDIRGAYDDYKKALDLEPDFKPAAEELKRFKVVIHKTDGA